MGVMTGMILLLPLVAAQTTTLLHETFDTPGGFTRTNLIGPVAFFNDPAGGDYFGINKGDNASYFSCPSALSFPAYGASSCSNTTWVGTDNAPADVPAYVGFTGAYIEAARIHGGGDGFNSASPFILTWTASGSCSGTLVFSGKFAEAAGGNMEYDDFIRVQASVDGAAPVTVLEFRGTPTKGLAVDTDLDGIGDGVALDLAAATFTANIPGMMTSTVVLMVSLRSTSSNEQMALDDIQLLCGPRYDSPPAPPSAPTVARHASRRARARHTHTVHGTHALTHTAARVRSSAACSARFSHVISFSTKRLTYAFCRPHSSDVLLHETFDSPAGFTTRNADGPVPFFSDGLSDYFGINNGQGTSYFGNRGEPPSLSGSYLGLPSEFGGPDVPNAFASLSTTFGSGECTTVLSASTGGTVNATLCKATAEAFAAGLAVAGLSWSAPSPFTNTSLIGEMCGDTCTFGTDTLPYNGEAFVGFDGAYLEAEDMDGESWNDPFTMTWATVSGSCARTLVFSGKFAMGNYRNIDSSDFLIVQASVDGAAAATILELRGNGDGSNNAFAVDSDGDGVGDGHQLTTHAQTLSAYIPGTMSTSVVLSVTFAVNGVNEEIAMDDLKITCGPTVHSPPPPPPPRSPPSPPPLPLPPLSPVSLPDCAAVEAEKAALQAEKVLLQAEIAQLRMDKIKLQDATIRVIFT